MILKASQRAGAQQLAAHLLRVDENEHVEVHEMRGFMADDLRGALNEAHAISKGTRCKQFLFSLSLNPPQDATVSDRDFKHAVRMVEQQLGLTGQPRAIVFHEKESRRHAHCVWSRIDPVEMKAVNLPHYKLKLRDVSRELYIKHEWRMPNGLVDNNERDPLNFTRAEWQQAKRVGQDPKAIKTVFHDCWASSDTRDAFAKALEKRGYWLAKGDRRGFVAVDFRGEVYSVAKLTGVKTRQVAERLGDPKTLPSVEQTRERIAYRMTDVVRSHIKQVEQSFQKGQTELTLRKRDMVRRHREDRTKLKGRQQNRWTRETHARQDRMRKGLLGLWDRLRGRYGQIKRENEREAVHCYRRDQTEKQTLIQKHLAERRELQRDIIAARQAHNEEVKALNRDVAHFVKINRSAKSEIRGPFHNAARDRSERPKTELNQTRTDGSRRGRRRRRCPE